MPLQRPNNWYDMDYHQQREWEDQDRQVRYREQDLEDERDRAEQQATSARRQAQAQASSYRSEISDLEEQIDQLRKDNPDLLQACEFLIKAYESWTLQRDDPKYIAAKNAIAKARGRR